MKKFFAMLLCLVLTFSLLTACGDKDDDDDKGGKKNVKVESVSDALEALEDLEEGTISYTMKMDMGDQGNMDMTVNMATNGTDVSLGLALKGDFDGQKVKIDVPEAMIVVKNTLYVNLGGVLKAIDDVADGQLSDQVDLKAFKWFAIPLPDDYKPEVKTNEKVMKAITKLGEDILKCGKEDGSKVTFDKADQLIDAMEVLADFVEKDAEDVVKEAYKQSTDAMESFKKIDINKYAKKLIDFYLDDVKAVAKDLGVDADMIDEYVDQIKEMDLQEMFDEAMEEYVPEDDLDDMLDDIDFEDAAEELRDMIEEAKDEDIEDLDFKIEVEASSKGSVVSFSVSFNAEDKEEDMEMTMSLLMDVDTSSPKISAPKDLCTIKDLADVIQEIAASQMR